MVFLYRILLFENIDLCFELTTILRSFFAAVWAALAVVWILLLSSISFAQPPQRDGYEVAWFDEFDRPELNTKLWTPADRKKTTNNSQQDYLPGQISIADGKLVINVENKPSRGLPFRSGLVTSTALQKHGRWEVRAKLPRSTGMWPAIWLLADVRWPSGGEIDIMENRGDQPTTVSSAFHFGTNPPYKHSFLLEEHSVVANGKSVNFQEDWHTYACEWAPTHVRFFVDDELHWTLQDDDVDGFLSQHVEPMRLVINTAVGGDFLDNPDDTTVWPQKMEIDYVHVYKSTAMHEEKAAPVIEQTDIRVMSFNLRYGAAKDGDNEWDLRKSLLADTINAFQPDLLGVQETLDFQASFLKERFPEFTYIGRSRDQNPVGGEQCGILFRSDRFHKLVEGYFWLSQTPDRPGSQSWDAAYPRMATWIKLWDRENRRSFYVLNTHFDHVGEQARAESATLIRKFLDELPPDNDFIVMGDFNTGEKSTPYKTLFIAEDNNARLVDTFRVANPTASSAEGTFNGFKGTDTGDRIDWIGASRNLLTQTATIDKTSRDGRYPSDHFPISAVLRFASEK